VVSSSLIRVCHTHSPPPLPWSPGSVCFCPSSTFAILTPPFSSHLQEVRAFVLCPRSPYPTLSLPISRSVCFRPSCMFAVLTPPFSPCLQAVRALVLCPCLLHSPPPFSPGLLFMRASSFIHACHTCPPFLLVSRQCVFLSSVHIHHTHPPFSPHLQAVGTFFISYWCLLYSHPPLPPLQKVCALVLPDLCLLYLYPPCSPCL